MISDSSYKANPDGFYKCPLCGGELESLYEIGRFTPPLNIYRCVSCHHQLQLRESENEEALYQEEYYTGDSSFTYRDERDRMKYDRYVLDARLRKIKEFVPAPADFLDVGCAFGSFVLRAQEAGYRAKGIDLSEYAVRQGRERGGDLYHTSFCESSFPDESFDAITMIEVIEHLPHPRKVAETLFRLLRKGGVAVIQTADFDGRQAREAKDSYHYYLPGHLHYYSARRLTVLLKEAGFTRFVLFRPVEFGLLPKLLKSRGEFRTPFDYMRWFKIALYHFKGKLRINGEYLTSSMVLYAVK